MVERFADCRVNYHADISALAFPTEYLSRRLPSPAEPVHYDELQEWSIAAEASGSPDDALYRLLVSRFRYRALPTLEQLSAIVGISSATLKRQLAASGMTYCALLDRLLFDEACDMLSVPGLSIGEIALQLGYSGTNNFVRSFRRMTGMTPGEYREREVLVGG